MLRFQVNQFKVNQPLLYKKTQTPQIKTKITESDCINHLISIHSSTLSECYV